MSKDERLKPYLLCIFSYFVLGCMILTINTINSPIIQEYAWKDSQGALLISFMSIGNLVMSIVGNMLMDRIGRNRALVLYICMASVSLGCMVLLRSPELYYFLMLIVGFAWGGINTLVNTVPTELYNGSSTKLNIMHACYAIGAVLFPVIVGFLIQHGSSWRIPVCLVLVLFAVQIIVSLRIHLPDSEASAHRNEKGFQKIAFWKELPFYFSTLTFLIYVGVESSVSTWLSPYLAQENAFFSRVPAQTMVSLMWLMLLTGRVVFSAIGAKVSSKQLLTYLSAGFLLGVLGLVYLSSSTFFAICSVILTGISMSAIYGLAVSVSARYVKASAVASGIMFGAGGFGSALIPYVSGLVSDDGGLRIGMLSLCGFLGILVIVSVMNMADWTKRKNPVNN